MSAPRPIFLFSLPRSGSTLVQRVLGTSDDVATVAEPWILLPYLYTLREEGVAAEYRHRSVYRAIEDFAKRLPGGVDDYRAAIRDMAVGLYGRLSPPGTRYFLDKTPRYSLVVEEILETFPDSPVLFLWRNPVAIAASVIHKSKKRRWSLHRFGVDFFVGLPLLVEAHRRHRDRICAVRYEDLVGGPPENWKPLFDHLDLPFDADALRRFTSVDVSGRFGDQRGTRDYEALTDAPLTKWQDTIKNPVRKAWCRRYLRWLGRERLGEMGYDLDALLADLARQPFSLDGAGSDLSRIATFGWPTAARYADKPSD